MYGDEPPAPVASMSIKASAQTTLSSEIEVILSGSGSLIVAVMVSIQPL